MMNKVREYRERKKKTQTQMAKEIGITNDYLSAIERGVRNPSFSLAKKIACYFDKKIDTIFSPWNRIKRSKNKIKRMKTKEE